MKQKMLLICGVFSASLVMIGFVGFEIMIFKPWASCPYGDTSTECASTDIESLLGELFFYIFLTGWFILICIFAYWIKVRAFSRK